MNRAFGLTEREVEVLSLIGAGFSNKDIARRLALSVRTVETHRLNIRKKTQSTRLSDLVSVARQISAAAPERAESPPRLHVV
jgi:DNA-binding CsgD family transcriptional regulator